MIKGLDSQVITETLVATLGIVQDFEWKGKAQGRCMIIELENMQYM
jgi:hypothetical protein